jgi:cadmium resistance protein CadD (predicted permease)
MGFIIGQGQGKGAVKKIWLGLFVTILLAIALALTPAEAWKEEIHGQSGLLPLIGICRNWSNKPRHQNKGQGKGHKAKKKSKNLIHFFFWY